MKCRKVVVPVLLLLFLLAGCGDGKLPEEPPMAPPTATPSEAATDEPEPEETEKPTVDDEGPLEALAWSTKPAKLTEADLTEEEQAWLAFVGKFETDPDGDYSYDGLSVSNFTMGDVLTVKAVTADGRGVTYDSGTGVKSVIRAYTPSPETQELVNVLVPQLEAWHAAHDDWPAAGWDMMDDEWRLEVNSMDEYEAAPVVLDLPETFDDDGYMFLNDRGYFDFTNELNDETVRVNFENNAYAGSISFGATPVS